MSADHLAIVILYPWRWLQIALAALSVVGWLTVLWRHRRTRHALADLLPSLIGTAVRVGLHDEAAQMQRTLEILEGRSWRRFFDLNNLRARSRQ